MVRHLRLGVNIDHVATLRNARGGQYPDILEAAALCYEAGADGITVHLREDRRHILDDDVKVLRDWNQLPLNLEMAPTDSMVAIAEAHMPDRVCMVPEKREELTTEGGLNLLDNTKRIKQLIARLHDAAINVSLFIDPDPEQVDAASQLGADCIELHTGTYAHAFADNAGGDTVKTEWQRLYDCAHMGHELGLEVHAGHGLTLSNVTSIVSIAQIKELNIGHYLVGRALFVGIKLSIQEMKVAMAS